MEEKERYVIGKGEKTVIDRMGLKIEKVWRER